MLFCTRTHTWIRLHKMVASGGLVQPRAAWRAQIGITARGLQDVGAPFAWDLLAKTGTAVRAGMPLLRIDWDGHRISDGDELYHTTWSSLEGSTTLVAPCDGTLLSLHEALRQGSSAYTADIDPETCLAELHVDKPALNSAVGLVNEEAYLQAVAGAGPGMFGDGKDALSYTGYG